MDKRFTGGRQEVRQETKVELESKKASAFFSHGTGK